MGCVYGETRSIRLGVRETREMNSGNNRGLMRITVKVAAADGNQFEELAL